MLLRNEVVRRLNGVFRDVFEDDSIEIRDEMTAQDLDEWDSLTHITLVIAVEREFGIVFKTAEVGKFENVGVMIDLLMARATK